MPRPPPPRPAPDSVLITEFLKLDEYFSNSDFPYYLYMEK